MPHCPLMRPSPLVLRGHLNGVALTLGASAVLIGLGCGYAVLGLGLWDETLVGAFIGGTPLGGLVILDALDGRRHCLRLDETGVTLDGGLIPWAGLALVREREIHRGIRTWFGRVELRRVRRLELHAAGESQPLVISDEWLAKGEYAAVRQALEGRTPIVTERVEEGE